MRGSKAKSRNRNSNPNHPQATSRVTRHLSARYQPAVAASKGNEKLSQRQVPGDSTSRWRMIDQEFQRQEVARQSSPGRVRARASRSVEQTKRQPSRCRLKLNQSLLHLDARWQNSILSRCLPTLNFDTLRSHQVEQSWRRTEPAWSDTQDRGNGVGLQTSLHPRRKMLCDAEDELHRNR